MRDFDPGLTISYIAPKPGRVNIGCLYARQSLGEGRPASWTSEGFGVAEIVDALVFGLRMTAAPDLRPRVALDAC